MDNAEATKILVRDALALLTGGQRGCLLDEFERSGRHPGERVSWRSFSTDVESDKTPSTPPVAINVKCLEAFFTDCDRRRDMKNNIENQLAIQTGLSINKPMTATRQQILSTAGQLFSERGYELVGINEIIEKSGVAKATFYSNFKSKENLCGDWMRSTAAESEKAGGELLRQKMPAIEKVARKFDLLKEYVQKSDFRGCPFSTTASMIDSTSEVCQIIRDYKANSRCFWQSLALEVRRDPGEARALGDTLFLLFSGAVTEAQNARHAWPVDSARKAALALCNTTPKD